MNTEDRIRYKGKGSWIVGISWMIVSGIVFYLLFTAVNSLGLYLILCLITFVIYIAVGFALKAPTLLSRNIFVYPLGIIVAQILNWISEKGFYTQDVNWVAFGVGNILALFFLYLFVSLGASVVLRLAIGYEACLGNPISVYSFFLKSAKEDASESLRIFVNGFRDVSAKVIREKEATWIKFDVDPNSYALAIAPMEKNEAEVNLMAYQIRNDVICDAEKEKAEIMESMIDALFMTRKRQGYVEEWRVEKATDHSGQLRNSLLEALTSSGQMPLKALSIRQVWHSSGEWLKMNKKAVAVFLLTAIVSPLVVYFVGHFLFG